MGTTPQGNSIKAEWPCCSLSGRTLPRSAFRACWLTELALGEDRTETAMRFICASLNVLIEQESQGKLAVIVAERLRHMADRLDELVVS